MSLEQSIQNLADAMNRIADAIVNNQMQLPLQPSTPKQEPKKEEGGSKGGKGSGSRKTEPAKVEPAKEEVKPAEATTPEEAPKEEAKPAEEDGAGETTPTVTLTSLRELARPLLQAGKLDQMREILAGLQAESLTALSPEHYGTAHAKLTALSKEV